MNSIITIVLIVSIFYGCLGNKFSCKKYRPPSYETNPQCMTTCMPHKDYHYCYKPGGWEYCKPVEADIDQYYTMGGEKCNGHCTIDQKRHVYWCYTGFTENVAWKDCDPIGGHKKGLHHKAALHLLSDYLLSGSGKYDSYFEFIRCGDGEVEPNCGVDEISDIYHRLFATTNKNPKKPITILLTATAPNVKELPSVDLPYVMRAKITAENLKDKVAPLLNINIKKLHALPGDVVGQLLSSTLGGSSSDYNFVPLVSKLSSTEQDSIWNNIEKDIRTFLQQDDAAYVDWLLVLTYDLNISRRPTGLGLRIRMYDDTEAISKDSGDMYFTNTETC